MGIEKQLVSSKMRSENIEFLNWRVEVMQPYEVSFSSLVDLCVSIVRAQFMKGEIALGPAALQVLLRPKGLPLLTEAVERPGLESGSPERVPIQARFTFFSRRKAASVRVVSESAAWALLSGFRPTNSRKFITERAS